MEFKKKTIIWEDNNEPPKNYIWVKSDGNAYEFNHTTRQWEKIMSSNGSSSGSDSGTGEIDYEAIYQFQIKKLKDKLPSSLLSEAIIPEHYSDVTNCTGTEYSAETLGVFKASQNYHESAKIVALHNIVSGVLFTDLTNGDIIFFGQYSYSDGQGELL